MFMTGTQLKGAITRSYDATSSSAGGLDKMWGRKLTESKGEGGGHGSGTHQSIDERGWDLEDKDYGHVNLYHDDKKGPIPEFDKHDKFIDDGHHRIAAAADIEARQPGRTVEIPVKHWPGLNNT